MCNGGMDFAEHSRQLLNSYAVNDLFLGARLAAENAGRVILEAVKSKGLTAIQSTYQQKGDGSPVSEIDRLAHESLCRDLNKLADFLIVSEEDPEGPLSLGQIPDGSFFWIADPLDGTRDFLAGEKTYAVALALMRKLDPAETAREPNCRAHPYMGIIHDPSGEQTWAAMRFGKLRKWIQGKEIELPAPERRFESGKLRVLGSRSIPSQRMQELYRFWGAEAVVRMGSAMKFALIAEGAYDVYPRFGPTSEWDTAAGQVLLEVSGGGLAPIAMPVRPMPYGKTNWLNPGFLAVGSRDLLEQWLPLLAKRLS